MRQARRGLSILTEALLVSLFVALIVFVAFMAVSYVFRGQGELTQTILDGRLCGYVLTVSNLGEVEAKITDAYGVTGESMEEVTDVFPSRTINPGEAVQVDLPSLYDEVIIVGENFEKLVVKNDCK